MRHQSSHWLHVGMLAAGLMGCSGKPLISGPPGRTAIRWVQTAGPSGSLVYSLGTQGTTLFAGTLNGIIRSTDAGVTWATVWPEGAWGFAVCGPNVFAGTLHGVMRSTDGGLHWSPANHGLPGWAVVNSILADGNFIFVGISGMGVYRSATGGARWDQVNEGLPRDLIVPALAASRDGLFAGTSGYGVFRSVDHGNTWTPASDGLPNLTVLGLAPHAGFLFAATTSGVFRLSDAGASWIASGTNLPGTGYAYAFVENSEELLVTTDAGPYRSRDDGDTWSVLSDGLAPSTSLGVLSRCGTNLFGGTTAVGVYRSGDDGVTWSPTGPATAQVQALAVSSTQLVAATLQAGVVRSPDQGATWLRSDVHNPFVNCIAAKGNDLFIAASNEGVLRSADGGAHFTPVNTGLPASLEVHGLAVVGTSVLATVGHGVAAVYRTIDDGTTWTPASNGLPAGVDVPGLATGGSDVYALTSADGVFRSADEGATWIPCINGLPGHPLLSTLAAGGTSVFVGVVGVPTVVYRSTDRGDHWTPTPMSSPEIPNLLVSGPNVFAATRASGVYGSTDAGATWASLGTGLVGQDVWCLASDGTSLFAGSSTGGVWRLSLASLVAGRPGP